MFFLDLLDSLGKKTKRDRDPQALGEARIIGLGDKGIGLRLPNNSAHGQFVEKAGNDLGLDFSAARTTPTSINLQDFVTRQADGSVQLDLTSIGGQTFAGSLQDLEGLRGQEVIDLVGNQATQNTANGTLSLNSLTGVGNILGSDNQINAATNKLSGVDSKFAAQLSAKLKNAGVTNENSNKVNTFFESLDSSQQGSFLDSLDELFNANSQNLIK